MNGWREVASSRVQDAAANVIGGASPISRLILPFLGRDSVPLTVIDEAGGHTPILDLAPTDFPARAADGSPAPGNN